MKLSHLMYDTMTLGCWRFWKSPELSPIEFASPSNSIIVKMSCNYGVSPERIMSDVERLIGKNGEYYPTKFMGVSWLQDSFEERVKNYYPQDKSCPIFPEGTYTLVGKGAGLAEKIISTEKQLKGVTLEIPTSWFVEKKITTGMHYSAISAISYLVEEEGIDDVCEKCEEHLYINSDGNCCNCGSYVFEKQYPFTNEEFLKKMYRSIKDRETLDNIPPSHSLLSPDNLMSPVCAQAILKKSIKKSEKKLSQLVDEYTELEDILD